MPGIVATAEITIAAPATTVPAALTDPRQIKENLFGSTVRPNGCRAADHLVWGVQQSSLSGQRRDHHGRPAAAPGGHAAQNTSLTPEHKPAIGQNHA
jgi:hypothetical protein